MIAPSRNHERPGTPESSGSSSVTGITPLPVPAPVAVSKGQ